MYLNEPNIINNDHFAKKYEYENIYKKKTERRVKIVGYVRVFHNEDYITFEFLMFQKYR